eukprot:COSAG04_NODE_538_length_12896_cov_41.168243_9_plen_1402_part_00
MLTRNRAAQVFLSTMCIEKVVEKVEQNQQHDESDELGVRAGQEEGDKKRLDPHGTGPEPKDEESAHVPGKLTAKFSIQEDENDLTTRSSMPSISFIDHHVLAEEQGLGGQEETARNQRQKDPEPHGEESGDSLRIITSALVVKNDAMYMKSISSIASPTEFDQDALKDGRGPVGHDDTTRKWHGQDLERRGKEGSKLFSMTTSEVNTRTKSITNLYDDSIPIDNVNANREAALGTSEGGPNDAEPDLWARLRDPPEAADERRALGSEKGVSDPPNLQADLCMVTKDDQDDSSLGEKRQEVRELQERKAEKQEVQGKRHQKNPESEDTEPAPLYPDSEDSEAITVAFFTIYFMMPSRMCRRIWSTVSPLGCAIAALHLLPLAAAQTAPDVAEENAGFETAIKWGGVALAAIIITIGLVLLRDADGYLPPDTGDAAPDITAVVNLVSQERQGEWSRALNAIHGGETWLEFWNSRVTKGRLKVKLERERVYTEDIDGDLKAVRDKLSEYPQVQSPLEPLYKKVLWRMPEIGTGMSVMDVVTDCVTAFKTFRLDANAACDLYPLAVQWIIGSFLAGVAGCVHFVFFAKGRDGKRLVDETELRDFITKYVWLLVISGSNPETLVMMPWVNKDAARAQFGGLPNQQVAVFCTIVATLETVPQLVLQVLFISRTDEAVPLDVKVSMALSVVTFLMFVLGRYTMACLDRTSVHPEDNEEEAAVLPEPPDPSNDEEQQDTIDPDSIDTEHAQPTEAIVPKKPEAAVENTKATQDMKRQAGGVLLVGVICVLLYLMGTPLSNTSACAASSPPTVAANCTGDWSACTIDCELAVDRQWEQFTASSGSGAACPQAPDCAPGEDECLPMNALTAALELDTDIGTIAEGTPERLAFETSFRTDMAAALGGIDVTRIEILSIQGGSVIINFAVFPASDGTPIDESVVSTKFAASGVPIAGAATAAPISNLSVKRHATCGDADGDGLGSAPVSHDTCGAGLVYNPAASSSLCARTSCNVEEVVEDRQACCAATCGDKDGAGPNSTSVSDEDCGSGLIYDPASSTSLCAGLDCKLAVVWTKAPGRYCGSAASIISTHSTEAAARAACEADDTCLSISDDWCDGTGDWKTCNLASGSSTSTDHCLYTPSDAVDKATCCIAQATCGDADGEGPSSAPVSDDACGAGHLYDPSASDALCVGTACAIDTVAADKVACCAAQASCGDADGDGDGSASVGDEDCGIGMGYDPSASASLCAGSVCNVEGVTADKVACCVCDCPELSLSGATVTYSDARPFCGSRTATYTCDSGAPQGGGASRTCQVDATWDGTAPDLCGCAALLAVSGMTIEYSNGQLVGSVATYSCDSGDNPTDGDASRTCLANGNWGGAAPTCTVRRQIPCVIQQTRVLAIARSNFEDFCPHY